jgi:uncharacterized membrane protein YvlD (DUF360 family)
MEEFGTARTRFAGRWALARVLVVWLATAAALFGLSGLLPGFHVDDFGDALITAAVIGLLNALVWPLIIRFALPFTTLTLGLGALFLNGVIVLGAAALTPGVHLDSVLDGVVLAIGLTLVSTLVTGLLAIDDDDLWYRGVARRILRRRSGVERSEVPGVLFLEIDGLAHEVLLRALRSGDAPTMARWVREGSHRLRQWETDWSSQTGACQAGLLHGSNEDMPAFRWWEKDRGGALVSNHPRDAMEMERRRSDGRGLLYAGGASRANLLSGDAPHSLLTMSTVLRRDRPGRIGQDYFTYFANPTNVSRTLLLVVADIANELYHAAAQRRRDVRPRVRRGLVYSFLRAWTTVIQRDLQVEALLGDIAAGRPVAYSTFLGYDEVAHHSGIERADALSTLRRVDGRFARLERALADAPRPYRLVVLSDHGQTQGETFLGRYGHTLEDVVREACEASDDAVDAQLGGGEEGLGVLSAALTEASAGDSAGARAVGRATRGRTRGDAVQLRAPAEVVGRAEEGTVVEPAESPAAPPARADAGQPPEIVVMASGCLGLVSFPRMEGRVTLEQLEARWPRLLRTLREHPGIGFVLVRSEGRGAVALGPKGEHRLDGGEVEGEDPLAPFGPRAAEHVRRTDGFANCPDLVINSTYWPETEEVAAFEELVGSHGGMGGTQSRPLVLAPADLPFPNEEVVGAEAMHRVLRSWLAQLGHDAYR